MTAESSPDGPDSPIRTSGVSAAGGDSSTPKSDARRDAFERSVEAYLEFVSDVESRERELEAELPFDSGTAGVAGRLSTPVGQWVTDVKPTRVVPAVVAVEAEGYAIPPGLLRSLVGLDAAVTALDDLVDRRDPTRADRFDLAAVATFGTLLSTTVGSEGGDSPVIDALLEYYVAMVQTPFVERAAAAELAAARTPEREVARAVDVYAYRARDIAAFVELPARVLGVEAATANRLLSDLRAFRGRQLLYDDIRDVATDVENGIETPIVDLLWKTADESTILERIEQIADSFPYSRASEDRYRTSLVDLEGRPNSLEERVAEAVSTVGPP